MGRPMPLPYAARRIVALLLVVVLIALAGGSGPGRPMAAASETGLDQVVAIATGSCRSFALRRDGTVWGWGCGSDWDFGVPALNGLPTDTPVQAAGLDDVRAIATGDGQTLALR